jgi:hypothetical protein
MDRGGYKNLDNSMIEREFAGNKQRKRIEYNYEPTARWTIVMRGDLFDIPAAKFPRICKKSDYHSVNARTWLGVSFVVVDELRGGTLFATAELKRRCGAP